MNQQMKTLNTQLVQQLVFAGLTYALGAGVSRYLGQAIRSPVFWLGLLACLAWCAGTNLLLALFQARRSSPSAGAAAATGQRSRLQLVSACGLLSLACAAVLGLLFRGEISLLAGVVLAVLAVLWSAISLPGLGLTESGFAELILAGLLGGVVPACAFLLQTEQLHRLIPFLTGPLILFALTSLLVAEFPAFREDRQSGPGNLLLRLGWRRAILVHHLGLLSAYLLLAVGPSFGVPWRLLWPAFLTLPFSVVEILWLERMAAGGRTGWNFLLPLSKAIPALSAYLLALSFWMN